MRHLCDSNVLLALAVRRHPHHERAVAWWDALTATDSVVLCRMTELALLRLLTTEAVMQSDTCTNVEAQAVLMTLLSDERVEEIRSEPEGLKEAWMKASALDLPAPKVWMDAYLASFAMGAGMGFITFDRGFERFRAAGLNLLLL